MSSHLSKDLDAALWSLADDSRWRSMLAENVYWASCEAFVQTTLLWAFNSRSKAFVADRERRLRKEPTWKPDLAIMSRDDHDAWWGARRAGRCDSKTLRRLARGIVELKVAWTPGNATGSAVLTQKAKTVRDDVDGLEAARTEAPNSEMYMGVIVSGFHKTEGAKALADSLVIIRDALPKAIRTAATTIPLLDGFESAAWKDILENGKKGYSSLLWIPMG